MPEEPPDPQETQPVSGEAYEAPPSMPTERLRVSRQHRPPPSLWAFLGLLVLAGVLIGFVFGHFTGRSSGLARDPNLVVFEPAGSSTPFPGAQFTASTFNPQTAMCDKSRLKQFLRADQHRFNAWVQLTGTTASDFDAFVDRLETARLTMLSPVTDHGCTDADCPFSFQAVLQAGTPVWRDPQQGHIVAKCLSSSPLSAPHCPPNCSGGAPAPATSTAPVRPEQTLPPETPSVAPSVAPSSTPFPVRTPAPVPTVTPF
jgi:hypothetical protein